jgi:hypothetical protein
MPPILIGLIDLETSYSTVKRDVAIPGRIGAQRRGWPRQIYRTVYGPCRWRGCDFLLHGSLSCLDRILLIVPSIMGASSSSISFKGRPTITEIARGVRAGRIPVDQLTDVLSANADKIAMVCPTQ